MSEELTKEIEKEEVEKVAEVAPYSVFGTDLKVNQPELIKFYKYRIKLMIMKYKLIGRVDDNGKYTIPDEIRRDLVKMEKEIEDMGDNYYKAIALYMKKHFYYTVKIEVQDDGMGKASLYISEYVEDFMGHDYISTHVADFVANYDDEFRIKLRKAFNLVDVGVKVDDTAVPELAVIMQDLFDLELVEGGLYDMACQIYLMNMMKLLEGSAEGKALLGRYRLLLGKRNVEVDEKFRYITYKSILDKLIDEIGGFSKLGLDPAKVMGAIGELNKTLMQVDAASKRGPLESQNTQAGAKKNLAAKKPSKSSKPKAAAKSAAPKKKDKPKAAAKEVAKKPDNYVAPGKVEVVTISKSDGYSSDSKFGATKEDEVINDKTQKRGDDTFTYDPSFGIDGEKSDKANDPFTSILNDEFSSELADEDLSTVTNDKEDPNFYYNLDELNTENV